MRGKGFKALAALALALALMGAGRGGGVDDGAILAAKPAPHLSAYGFFADPAAAVPNAGVRAYALNSPLYSDGAAKGRFIYLPAGAQARPGAPGETLALPVGTVLIKTFSTPAGRRLETRLLIRKQTGWVAAPYVWDAEGKDAKLSPIGAVIADPWPGGPAAWTVPNVNQCKGCHAAGDALVPIGPKPENMGEAWIEAAVRDGALAHAPSPRAAMPAPADADASLDPRARAYLDVNCAHCHNPSGPASNSGLDLRFTQTNPAAFGVEKRPVAAGRGSAGLAFAIAPGDPEHSFLLTRMQSTDPGVMMPELGRSLMDAEGVALIRQWIREMGPPSPAG